MHVCIKVINGLVKGTIGLKYFAVYGGLIHTLTLLDLGVFFFLLQELVVNLT